MKKNLKCSSTAACHKNFIFSLLITVIFNSSLYSATYYFANSGNDANTFAQAQSQTTPWQSISKLNSIISSLQPGDNILFKRGDVFIGQINISNLSGNASSIINFGAYGTGVNPTIDGSAPLTSWTNISGNIWQTSFTLGGSAVTCLTINGKAQDIGRWPNLNTSNKGYLNVDSHVGNTQITSTGLAGAPTSNWTGAEVVYRGARWVINRASISSQSSNSINFTGSNGYQPINNWGFFIQNHDATLDQEGEWFYNGTTKAMKLYSTTNPNTKNIRASYLTNNINITNSNFITFKHLTLTSSTALNFSYSNSSYVTIEDCKSINAGQDAIFGNNSNNISILNDTILNTYNNAIDGVNVNSLNISNNYIKNTGYVRGMGGSGDGRYNSISANGFSGSPSLNLTILNNVLDSCGYLGISFYGYSNVLIKNNFVNNFCLIKDDGSGIYTFSGASNNQNYVNRIIESNIVLNGISSPEGTSNLNQTPAEGIYMDDNVKNVKIINNTVANCGGGGLYLHNAHEIELYNNTFYNNTVEQFKMVHETPNQWEAIVNCVIKNNIYFSKLHTQRIGEVSTSDNGLPNIGIVDSNYYCRPFDETYTMHTYDSVLSNKYIDLNCWKSMYGHDVNSKMTSKQFKKFTINSLIGPNLYNGGGTFSTSTNGIGCNNSGNNCSVTWDNTGVLDGGSLKFTAGTGGQNRLLNGCGAVSSTKNYILKFSLKGTVTCGYLDVYLRKNQSPYNNLTPNQFVKIDTARTEHVILFSSPTTEPVALVGMNLYTGYGSIYLDNVELYEANVTMANPNDSIKFEYNPTLTSQTIPLTGAYIDVKNNTHVGSTTLAPFGSVILLASNCTVFPIPGLIQAEGFCSTQGAVTDTTSDTGGGLNVGSLDNGDWIDIPVNVSATGNYVFSYRIANQMSTPSSFTLLNDGASINTVTVPITGGWQTYQTVTSTASLTAGSHVLRIKSNQPFNLNWVDVIAQVTTDINIVHKDNMSAFLYPNPAGKFVTINYSTTTNSLIKISLLDVLGKTVAEIEPANLPIGNYSNNLNLERISHGIYFVKIQSDDKFITKKLIVE